MGTPSEKVSVWFAKPRRRAGALAALRAAVLEAPVEEALKWRQPTYVAHGGNVAMISDRAAGATLSLLKGAILSDPEGLLAPPGPNSRSAMIAAFEDEGAVEAARPAIAALMAQAVENEREGRRPDMSAEAEIPSELAEALAADPDLSAAWDALTPGRRRGYVVTLLGAKRPQTRAARIARWRDAILAGRGLHDR